ncbi:YbaK/EbsC family protein [Streptomyces sp. H27-D2]|uniref:YbaK/EbsC family protein n=1 Tax=Streptomyces sp. H27-D2 TaxID=3046304 RepID=UPI002DBFB474|nr:YbaK/EbsC family protein [Streptomyces sp. H27-D2]MEC4015235.1 YbaK/EbsC family protein [Streptomyces sp. H27-D2]
MSTPDTADTAHPRFAAALRELGLDVEVRSFPEATRTAAEAAAAVGCELSQIVKSLIFEADGQPVLVLLDGASRVDVERVRAELAGAGPDGPTDGGPVTGAADDDGSGSAPGDASGGGAGGAKVRRASAELVRETTGYAIGGVPPFGHRTRTRVLADRGLLAHRTVWAAAGTPHSVFALAPESLIAHSGATLADVREVTA